MISDNDMVVLAYRNETTGVIGNAGKLGPAIGVLVGLVGAAFAFAVFGSSSFGVFPMLVGLVFLAVATFSAIRFMKIKSADDLLARSTG
jgi:hypothetical protein